MGPSIATQIILSSGLKNHFELVHIDTKINTDIREMGVFRFNKLNAVIRIFRHYISEIKRKKPELILIPISQSSYGFLKDAPFILIASALKIRSLLHLRGSEFRTWYEKRNLLFRSAVKFVIRRSDGVIVLGNNLCKIFKGLFSDDRIYVCPNGANFEFPVRNNSVKKGIEVLSIGNLQASKGIEDLLAALTHLNAEELERSRLTVLGSWRDEATRERCMQMVSTKQLPVRFLGQESSHQKTDLLANADIFVFTPRAPEGHPWVIVEAMAAGLPIISTDRGAITESVENDVNGFIVPLKDPKAIAIHLSDLIANPEKRQRMGELSRKKYLMQFTEDKMTENLREIFCKVLNINK